MAAILSALFAIFGIMLFGMITERRRLFPPSMALCLNQFVYWVSLPCLLFSQMCTLPGNDSTRALVWGGLAASMLGYLAFYALFSLGFRHNTPAATVRTLGSSFPNAAFFGLPFVLMVFPGSEDALNANMICALLYTGVSITADTSLEILTSPEHGTDRRRRLWRILRELSRNPMVMASLTGLSFSLAGVRPPEAVLRIASMLASTCAPCALFSMGMVLSAQVSGALGPVSLRDAFLPVTAVSLFRLLLSPFIAYVVLRFAGCTGDMLAAATVTFAMPVAVMVYILAERYRSSAAEASLCVVVSTLLSLVTLPVVMWALSYSSI